jgi:large subunit ribosomal protein L35
MAPVVRKDQKEAQVPKFKPHTGTGKRVKVTGKGKLVREQAGKRHLLEGKSSHVTRRMTGVVVVDKADTKRVKKLLGR